MSEFTDVSTRQGFAYVAFVIDTFANRIVGRKVSGSAKTDFVLVALEQALWRAGRCTRAASFTTATGAGNTCPSATPGV